MKKSHPWDQLQTEQGDSSQVTTFAAVGEALTCWTQYELDLARLFALLLTHSPEEIIVPPMMALGAVRTFEGRAAMIQTAGALFFDVNTSMAEIGALPLHAPQMVKEWRKTFDNLMANGNRFVGRRNEIAHGIVSPLPWGRGKKRYALQPAFIEKSKQHATSMPKFLYSSVELKHYATQFTILGSDTSALLAILREFLLLYQLSSP